MDKELFKKAVDKVRELSKINRLIEFDESTYADDSLRPEGPYQGYVESVYKDDDGSYLIVSNDSGFLFTDKHSELDDKYLAYLFEMVYDYLMSEEEYGDCDEFLVENF